MMSVACLVIGYVAVLCHLIPELLGNAALIDNGDGIVSALRTQRYGIGQRTGEIHDLAGYRADHGSRRDGNDRHDRRDIRSNRQLDSDGSGTLIDLTIHTQDGEACDLCRAGRGRIIIASAALCRDRLTALVQHSDGVGTACQIIVAAQRERGCIGKVYRDTGGRRAASAGKFDVRDQLGAGQLGIVHTGDSDGALGIVDDTIVPFTDRLNTETGNLRLRLGYDLNTVGILFLSPEVTVKVCQLEKFIASLPSREGSTVAA